MWLSELKIAVIEKDTDKINSLLDNLPDLKTKEESEEAIYLLKEASNIVHALKDETASTMRQMKKNIDFLKSTQEKAPSKLDLKS